MGMRYKYHAEISNIQDCPLPNAKPPEDGEIGWRLVFSPLGDERNFLPQSKVNPRRLLNSSSDEMRCKCYALSLFETKESLRNNMRAINKRNLDKIGTHLARGTLLRAHGVRTDANSNHHFSLWVAENVDLRESFTIEEPL